MRETGLEAFLVNLGCCPFEWAGGLVGGFDESVDVGLEFVERIERGTSERFAGEDRKPDLDLVEPGCAGWRKMEVHVWMALQPAIILRLVRVEIVEDDMDLASSVLSDNPVHEVEKFKPSSPLVLTPRHLARRNVESGEERRRAMPGVVVRLASQIALRALQRLDRRFLVDGQ